MTRPGCGHVIGDAGLVGGPSTALIALRIGGPLWSTDESLEVRPHDARHLYVRDRNGEVRAIDRRTGRAVWTVRLAEEPIAMSVGPDGLR